MLLPDLVVIHSAQRYEHLRAGADGGGVVRYSSENFSSELARSGRPRTGLPDARPASLTDHAQPATAGLCY